MDQTIVIEIATDGGVQLHTHGFKGRECQSASRELEAALGLTEKEELLSEYFEMSNFHETNNQQEINRDYENN